MYVIGRKSEQICHFVLTQVLHCIIRIVMTEEGKEAPNQKQDEEQNTLTDGYYSGSPTKAV